MLAFEEGEGGRLISTLADGETFAVGEISHWRPGERLAFSFRPASLQPDLATRVEGEFAAVGDETRVSVTHKGWTKIPSDHAARHGFPDLATQDSVGRWWRGSLDAFATRRLK